MTKEPKLLEDQVGEFFVNREGELAYFKRWASTISKSPLNSLLRMAVFPVRRRPINAWLFRGDLE
ncbi:MAG: hypothetical protein AAF639_38525, partial [Chloroflexota bacterium]